MEAKKRGRGRPKKALGATIPPPPKAKKGRPKKVNKIEAYDIETNEVVTLTKEAFENHLQRTSTFEFIIHDGNGKVSVDGKGKLDLGYIKLHDFYLVDKDFRTFINGIITGALELKAKKVTKELDILI